MRPITRREFLATSAAAAGLSLVPGVARTAPAAKGAYSFVFLGDLHYDRLEHHDMTWVKADKPNDVSQIQNYSRITRELSPRLLATVRETIANANRSGGAPVRFVLQAGDLVEGLCGSEELSVRQNQEALAFFADARLGVPMLFTKGNHDITGPGAVAAFGSVFLPFLSRQARELDRNAPAAASACYTVDCGAAEFAFFDAYQAAESLDWLEGIAARRTSDHLFVIIHPPVVPYGARSNWTVFATQKERARRERLLELLGRQHALVLGGHIHRYNRIVRKAGGDRFSQFAISSVITDGSPRAKDVLDGIGAYTPDQVRVEPNFSPANEAERRAIYEPERPLVAAFEYADLPGYALITVDGPSVTARMFSGVGRELWRTVELNPTRV